MPLSVIEIPAEIREQEREIESMLLSLIRFGDIKAEHLTEHRATDARQREIAVWILVAGLGLASMIGFSLLWIYGAGGC